VSKNYQVPATKNPKQAQRNLFGWFCAVACLAAGTGRCANAPAPNPNPAVAVWTEENGLPQNVVLAMTQTRDGYLWLGAGSVLTRFDGTDFKIYEERDIPGLNGSKIIKLFEDSHRDLWIGTETSGVLLIDTEGKARTVLPPKGTAEGPLRSICEDKVGGVWLTMSKGQLYRYWNGSVRLLVTVHSPNEGCGQVAVDKSGLVWVSTFDGRLLGLGPITDPSGSAIPVAFESVVGHLDFLLASKSRGYWRLADGQVQKCEAEQIHNLGPYPWSPGAVVLAACEDSEGNLIVGTFYDGVYWFDREGHAVQVRGLSHNSIWCLTVDREGELWVGTNGRGLNRVRRQFFSVLEGTRESVVQSVCEDGEGGLWIGYNGEHVDHWNGSKLESFNSLVPIPREQLGAAAGRAVSVRTVLVDSRSRVWIGAAPELVFSMCLFQYQNGRFNPTNGIDHEVDALFEDRQRRIWAGTQGGLACLEGDKWKTFTARDGLSSDSVRALAQDQDGNLWVGTQDGGLNLWRDGKFTVFRKQGTNGLPSDNVTSLYADPEGVLWIGTSSGLARFYHGQWNRFTTQEGLHSNEIGYLLEDSLGYFWIGSNNGLMRVAKKDLNAFVNGAIGWIPCRAYDRADGLPTRQCTTGSQPGACRTRAGKLWFPTISGLVGVDPATLHPNTNPPPVIIEAVRVDNQLQTGGALRAPPPKSVVVPVGKEVLEVEFTALNLSAPDKVRFRFQLVEYEKTPTERPANIRSVRYPKLPHGHYKFEVTACNEDGLWNPNPTVLAVTVLPAIWQTGWFKVGAGLTLLAMLIGSVYYVSTQKLQRQLAALRQQEALEKERSRIARDLHDQLGANLTQVALLGEMVETDKDEPAEVENHARQISQTARDTTRSLDEIVWTVNPSNDTLDGLINYVCKYAQEYLALAGLKYRLEVPPQLPHTSISPELRHNVFLAAKEAVNNLVKHAKASAAWVRLRLEPNRFVLEIEDNGRGLAPGAEDKGRNGLRNMRKRMEDVGGQFESGRGAEGGTKICLVAPLSTIK
jgi:ligand-binding sensor domain-containing protein/signal transduction histidine kinase